MFDTDTSPSYVVFGPQVYSGDKSAPVFAPGIFDGADQTNGLDGVLTITATPLPSTWTMLIAGFAGLGFFAFRGSKKGSAAIAAA